MTVLFHSTLAETLSRSRRLAFSLTALAVSCASLCQAQVPASAKPTAAHLERNFGKIPLNFEPNRGQTDARVQFLSRGQGYALYLTPGEAVLDLQKPMPAASKQGEKRQDTSTLAMKLVGANRDAAVTAKEVLPGTVNYFIGSDQSKWKTALPTYRRIAYAGVYPGIDLVYYGNQRELEYDFVVAPHADPSSIALQFSGATSRIDVAGDLVLSLSGGETRFHKPVVYQLDGERKVSITSRYVLAENQVHFGLGAYDHTKPLIIDPVLSYLTYIGGSQSDLINGIAIDSSGSAYVVARSFSLDYPVKNAYQSANTGAAIDSRNSSIAVSKFNATGTALVYSTYLGSTGSTDGNGIAVDSGGNAYVVGHTSTGAYPITAGAFQTLCGGSSYAGVRVNGCTGAGQGDDGGVLTKLNPTGTALVYSTYLSGDNYNSLSAVAVNSAGEAYVVGLTNSYCGPGYPAYGCLPTTSGAVQFGARDSTGGGTRNFTFFSKFDAAGANLIYSTLLGPNNFNVQSSTVPYAVAIDPAGLAYIVGTSSYNLYTTPGSYQPSIVGAGSRAFVAKFDTVAQKLLYSTFVTGTGIGGNSDAAYGIAADASGNAYVAGSTNECTFPVTSGAYETQASYPPGTTTNCNAGFVSKLNPAGSSLLWSTFVGNNASGNNNTYLSSLTLGSDGSVYIGGIVSGTGFPFVNPTQTQTDFNNKALIARLNPAGSAMLFATSLGGVTTSSDSISGIAVDPSGNIYVAGQTNSYTLPTTAGAFQSTSKLGSPCCGNVTGFVAKIAPTITSTTTLTLPSGTVTAGQAATIMAKVSGPAGTATTPTGTVTFFSGTTTLGTGTLDGTGTATYTAASLNATTYTVTASYPGDSNFSPSASSAQSLVVFPATATVALTAPTTATPGASVTLTVRVTGTSGTPTGSVTFKDGATTLSTVALVSGAASFSSSAFTIGSHSLSASYTGDSIFGAATSPAQTLVVALATPTVTLTAPATALVGGSVTLAASVASPSGTPTGTVTFKDGSTTLSTVTLVSGTASYTTSALAAGGHTITANYSGDAMFSAVTSAASTVTITVAPAITFSASPASLTVTRGMSVVTVITGMPVGGYTGAVTFSCGTLPAGASCVFAPASLAFTGTNVAASTTLTFSTTTTTTASLDRLPGGRTLGGALAAVLLMPFLLRRKRIPAVNRLLLWLLIAGGSMSLLGLGGCSDNAKGPTTITTAPGVYVVPVTVTAGTAMSTVSLSITVQ